MLTDSPSYPLGPALDFLRSLWRVSHALEQLSSRMDQRLGVTAQQRLVVRCVGKYPGMTAGHLAQLLHIDPGTASATLKRLDEKGILTRRRDTRDRRRIALGLTAKGRQIDRPLQGTVEDAAERLLAEVRPADTKRAVLLLERLAKLLETSRVRRPRPRKRATRA